MRSVILHTYLHEIPTLDEENRTEKILLVAVGALDSALTILAASASEGHCKKKQQKKRIGRDGC